jgi:glyoxylate reductase
MKTRPRVLVTRSLPGPAIDRLKEVFRVEINRCDRGMTPVELISRIRDKDGLLCLLTDRVDKTAISAGSRLRVIANYAVGFNNIDVGAATERGIYVTNTPGVLTETTADLAFALLISASRRIPEADRFVRSGRFKGWEPELKLGMDVFGKTIGIIGLGRIGQAVARRARGFDMKVIYYEPKRFERSVEKKLRAEYRPLDRLLRESDFITIHLPLTAETRRLISRRKFALMKRTAVLVNTARGPVVDEPALAEALRKKRIFGAGLDVYENEPRLAAGLAVLPNVVLLPHIGSATFATRSKMAMMCVENLVCVLVKGRKPPNLVNPQVLR